MTKHIRHESLGIIKHLWLMLESVWLHLGPRNKYLRAVNEFVKKNAAKHESTLAFLKALALNPRTTGAVLPSSKYLARAMVSYITLSKNGLVVELGAGTGVITRAMLESGIPAKQIIAIEYAPNLAKELRKHFPEIKVIEGNAADLGELLKNKSQSIDTIISGLPLRSLNAEIAQAILAQIPVVLSPQGRYIQFTYDLRSESDYYPENFHLAQSTIIWRNIPPAKVDVFTFL